MRGRSRGIWLVVALGVLSLVAAIGYAVTDGQVHRGFGIAFLGVGAGFLGGAAGLRLRRQSPQPDRPPSRLLLIAFTFLGADGVLQAVIDRHDPVLRVIQGALGVLLFGYVAWFTVPAWSGRRRDRDEISR